MFIHESTYIDEDVTIGAYTKIWHFCHIRNNTKIGIKCSIGQNCVIGPKVNIGDKCKIQNNVSIFEGVEIGNRVFIGPSVVFTNVLKPRAAISQKDNFMPTIIEDDVTLGANCTIICGVTIHKGAFVGAGSVVTKDVQQNTLVVGNPAKIKSLIKKVF